MAESPRRLQPAVPETRRRSEGAREGAVKAAVTAEEPRRASDIGRYGHRRSVRYYNLFISLKMYHNRNTRINKNVMIIRILIHIKKYKGLFK